MISSTVIFSAVSTADLCLIKNVALTGVVKAFYFAETSNFIDSGNHLNTKAGDLYCRERGEGKKNHH